MLAAPAILLALAASLATPGPHVPTAPSVVTVRAMDYAFQAPKTIKSGPTTFRLVNDGKELHHLTIVKLAKGKTMADFAAAMTNPGPPPAWITEVGGPNPAWPNEVSEATLTLDAGEYVLICFIPSPGETRPHASKGMVGSLTVLPESNGATVPAADVTLHTSDYAFAFSRPLSAGRHVVEVVNDGKESHEVVVIELAPGKTVADFGAWAGKDRMQGAPPGRTVVGGMAALAAGRSASFPMVLEAGRRYGLICFVPGPDGKSHYKHGMATEIAVR